MATKREVSDLAKEITLGTDPEILDIGHYKDVDESIETDIGRFRILRDMINIELNTPSFVLEGRAKFMDEIMKIRDIAMDKFPLSTKCVHHYDSIPEELRGYGCQPDDNIYNNIPERDPADNVRTAGCHIHIGSRRPEVTMEIWLKMDKVIKNLDKLYTELIVPNLTKEELSLEVERHKRYGCPGTYRRQDWGVEWRVPSNILMFKRDMYEEVFVKAAEITAQTILT